MVNPAIPNERHRVRGNPGHKKLPDLATVATLEPAREIPQPLRTLGTAGQSMWNRIWESGAVWLSPSTDIEYIQLMCEALDERQALRIQVLREGSWRDRNQLRKLEAQLASMITEIGFTPAERTRLGVAEVKALGALEQMRANAAR